MLRRRESDGAIRRRGDEPVKERFNLWLWQRTGEAIDDLSGTKGMHGGYSLDAELLCELLLAVDIDLGEDDLPAAPLDGCLQHGPERPAGPAPRCPEVHHDGHVMRPVDDLARETLRGDVDDGDGFHG